MYWKNPLLLFLFSGSLISCNHNHPENDEKKEHAAYTFIKPENWQEEHIQFPIDFAPGITYKGEEVLRFAPGFVAPTSSEYWSYTFLWWLEGKPSIDTGTLQKNFTEYYSGLIAPHLAAKSIPAGMPTQPVVKIDKIETEQGDTETFAAAITMLDYMNPAINLITLNGIIHKKDCGDHTAVVVSISPQPKENKVWEQLNQIENSFECNID